MGELENDSERKLIWVAILGVVFMVYINRKLKHSLGEVWLPLENSRMMKVASVPCYHLWYWEFWREFCNTLHQKTEKSCSAYIK